MQTMVGVWLDGDLERNEMEIANAIEMTDPDAVFVNTGSEADVARVRKMSLEKGEEKPLAMKDHTIHYDLAEEQGRIVDRTYYIINEGEPVSVLGNKMIRDEALAYIKKYFVGIMKGKRMMVGFFSRGPAGAKLALPALEITSSTYVMHSGDILYRHVYDRFDEQVKLSGFGNFDLRDKNQRPGRNPKTGEEIPISARRVVTFRPGQKLRARVEAYVESGD